MTLRDLDHRERQRLLRSAGAGALCWVLLLGTLALIPSVRKAPVKNEFPPVRLTLKSPVPAAARVAAAPEQPPTEAKSPAQTKASPAAKAPAKAPATAKAPAAAKTPAPSTSAAASSGLGIPDFASPVTSSRTDEGRAEYLDFSSPRPTERPLAASVPPGGNPASEFSGTAASVTPSGGGAAVSSKRTPAAGGAASSDTEAALRSVEGAASSGGTASSSSSGASGSAAPAAAGSASARTSSVAGLTFDGTPRRLIYPENPKIVLPERLARLVNSDRTVTVQFTVRSDGSVPGTLVNFTPLAALPAEIRDWLRSEFSAWRFEVGNQDGQARFTYSIKME